MQLFTGFTAYMSKYSKNQVKLCFFHICKFLLYSKIDPAYIFRQFAFIDTLVHDALHYDVLCWSGAVGCCMLSP